MDNTQEQQRLTAALHWLVEHQQDQPSLDDLARFMGLSPAYTQKCFQHGVGVSPKKFLQYLTREAALERLRAGATVLEAALDAGLSGTGRLHDLLVNSKAVTPGEARNRGKGLKLSYGQGASPFGPALVAWTDRGIAFLGFTESTGLSKAELELRSSWPAAEFECEVNEAQEWLDRIFAVDRNHPLPIWLQGSPFQLQVWEALLRIPPGCHATYGMIARAMGRPTGARAVGGAIGSNPIAWLIPCHRVIGQLGNMTGYRWGIPLKQVMIGSEAAAAERADAA